MTLAVACPHCGKSLQVADELQGRRVKCRSCQKPFQVGGAPAGAPDASLSTSCPHCGRPGIRFAPHEMNAVLECKKCGGKFTPAGGAVAGDGPALAESAPAAGDAGYLHGRVADQ